MMKEVDILPPENEKKKKPAHQKREKNIVYNFMPDDEEAFKKLFDKYFDKRMNEQVKSYFDEVNDEKIHDFAKKLMKKVEEYTSKTLQDIPFLNRHLKDLDDKVNSMLDEFKEVEIRKKVEKYMEKHSNDIMKKVDKFSSIAEARITKMNSAIDNFGVTLSDDINKSIRCTIHEEVNVKFSQEGVREYVIAKTQDAIKTIRFNDMIDSLVDEIINKMIHRYRHDIDTIKELAYSCDLEMKKLVRDACLSTAYEQRLLADLKNMLGKKFIEMKQLEYNQDTDKNNCGGDKDEESNK